jgi:nitroimidazol reductase NimA-like FMN-containing flavoprotein (pyridoxamine 5'-phosphate oxidase superfamily)
MTTSTLDTMKGILRTHDMCVLATCAEGKPHCSLMAYLADDAGTMIYMVTLKQTKKYRNFLRNPSVSLLVDTRVERHIPGKAGIKALTVSGHFLPITEKTRRDQVIETMAVKHPHLRALLADEDAEPFAIRIQSFLLLDGALEKHFVIVLPDEDENAIS